MGSRALWAGPTLSVGSGVVLGTFEVQGWDMPDPLAAFLVILAVLGVLIAAGALAWDGIHASRRGLSQLEWTPVVRRKTPPAPDPDAWLKEIAKTYAFHPEKGLLVLRQQVDAIDLRPETTRPYLDLALLVMNTSVHMATLGPTKGRMKWRSHEFVQEAESEGRSNYPLGHCADYRFRAFVPKELAAEMYAELAGFGEIRALETYHLLVEVESSGNPGVRQEWRPQLVIGGSTWIRP